MGRDYVFLQSFGQLTVPEAYRVAHDKFTLTEQAVECAGIKRRGVVNEIVTQERSSEPS